MTVADETMIEVQNLTDSVVAYNVPETGLLREFAGQQVRKISAGELRMLYSARGGKALLENYLSIKDKDLAKEFNISDDAFEHEYNWTQKEVDTVLKYGSLDALKDALEFGPDGIKELIIDRAVALKIPDTNKLKAIEEFTGRNVSYMIEVMNLSEDSSDDDAAPKSRRVSGKTPQTQESKRRVSK